MRSYIKITPPIKLAAFAVVSLFHLTSFCQIYSVSEFSHNSEEADFSAVFFGDDIVFCSSRTRKTTTFNEDSVEVYYTDLFQSKYDGSSSFYPPEPLKGNVNGFFNEGHATFSKDGLTMYYTANLIKKTGKSKSKTDEYKLGIFIAKLINGEWTKTGEFEYNSLNSKFSCAHPCLTQGDSVLYFASNRPGGFGGSDIYRCKKMGEGWSEPENLGENVNDEGNEFFPFINRYGVLFFTSDGRYDSEGMDIYCCYTDEKNKFEDAFRLNNTINSSYDELAYCEKGESNTGCFSSNRNNNQDDVFLFTKTEEQNRQCVESIESILCYRFVDENLQKLEKNLPIVYKWDLGDGNVATGDTIEHCYQNSGTYTIVLNAIDTVTKMTFSRISEAQVVITDHKQPVIYIPDTVYSDIRFEASIDHTVFDKFEIKEIKWQLNEGQTFEGKSFEHALKETGVYQLKCELFGEKKQNGIRPRICLYKNFSCIVQPVNQDVIEPMIEVPVEQPVEIKMNTKTFGNYSMKDLAIGDNFYMLVIAESVNPISFEDSIFKNIDGQISEIKTEKGYIYAIERKDSWKDLLTLHDKLRNKGIKTSYAEVFNEQSYDKSVVRKGQYREEAAIAENTSSIAEVAQSNDPSISSQKNMPVNLLSTDALTGKTNEPEQSDEKPNGTNTTITLEGDKQTIDIISALDISEEKAKEPKNESSDSANNQNKESTQPNNPGINSLNVAGQKSSEGNVEMKVLSEAAEKKNSANDEKQSLSPSSAKPQTVSTVKPTPSRKSITLYHIVVDSSSKRIPFNASFFKNIHTEIAELRSGSNYKYTILTASEPNYLENALVELKSAGYKNAQIAAYDLQQFSDSLLKMGGFIQPQNTDRLNSEFANLSDIKFDYNSSEVLPVSFATLDYIASILVLESGFKLKINAHTCNIGNSSFNKKLSDKRAQSVMNYFISKGIEKERLIATGYGDSKPAASNFTIDGRSTNRRVEFVIMFEGNK